MTIEPPASLEEAIAVIARLERELEEERRGKVVHLAVPVREGDVVDHGPTGETWVVSAVAGAELIPAGWPETIAKVADCTLVERGTDDDHRDMVTKARSSSATMRSRWARAHRCPVCEATP